MESPVNCFTAFEAELVRSCMAVTLGWPMEICWIIWFLEKCLPVEAHRVGIGLYCGSHTRLAKGFSQEMQTCEATSLLKALMWCQMGNRFLDHLLYWKRLFVFFSLL